MGRGKEQSVQRKANRFFVIILLLLSVYPVALYAAVASIIVQRPVKAAASSSFQIRTLMGTTRAHKGADYGVPVGTVVQTMGPVQCKFQTDPKYPVTGGGYGRYADATQTCTNGGTILFRYAHLSACTTGATTVKTGGAKGASGSGRTTNPHLHFEIRLPDGTVVDPEFAYGKNLCDPAVQKELKADAQKKLNGKAGGGGGATAPINPTAPPPSAGGGSSGGTAPPAPIIPPSIPDFTYNPPPQEDYIDPGPFPPTTDQYIPETKTNNPVTGCSTEVWRAMVNQSVLQTRREMVINERFIAKGDSVLAYSCFEELYWKGGETLPILSETDRWKNAQIDILGKTVTVDVYMGEYSLDGAIVNAVDEAVLPYMDRDFDHGWLGDVYKPVNMGTTPAQDDEDDHEDHGREDEDGHFHGTSESQYGYPCGKMNEVWKLAKCMNLADATPFYRFEDLVNFDPRQFPHGYECLDSGITPNMIALARHSNVRFDKIVTYLDFIYPKDKECADPIQTGLTVTRRVGTKIRNKERTYLDAICITPGCTYQNPESKELGTCETTVKPTIEPVDPEDQP